MLFLMRISLFQKIATLRCATQYIEQLDLCVAISALFNWRRTRERVYRNIDIFCYCQYLKFKLLMIIDLNIWGTAI